jgi:hypothetical protein
VTTVLCHQNVARPLEAFVEPTLTDGAESKSANRHFSTPEQRVSLLGPADLSKLERRLVNTTALVRTYHAELAVRFARSSGRNILTAFLLPRQRIVTGTCRQVYHGISSNACVTYLRGQPGVLAHRLRTLVNEHGFA